MYTNLLQVDRNEKSSNKNKIVDFINACLLPQLPPKSATASARPAGHPDLDYYMNKE
jgi:hypothetical protein